MECARLADRTTVLCGAVAATIVLKDVSWPAPAACRSVWTTACAWSITHQCAPRSGRRADLIQGTLPGRVGAHSGTGDVSVRTKRQWRLRIRSRTAAMPSSSWTECAAANRRVMLGSSDGRSSRGRRPDRYCLTTTYVYCHKSIALYGLLLPLVLTQSRGLRTVPLALAEFQGQASIILAAVTLTLLPIIILYAIGRRQLQNGLTAGFSK
jgi:hypothetical protein